MMKAENGREYDAESGDQQRVEQTDPEGAAVGRTARRIFDQRLADVEAGGLVPEAEAGGDLRPCEIVDRVAGGAVDEEADHRAEHNLVGDAADLRVVVEDDTARGAPTPAGQSTYPPRRTSSGGDNSSNGSDRGQAARGQSAQPSGQRIGGAYWMPPLVHSLFKPRSILSGEPCPTLRSNNSP